jgi:hypothetical protein
VCLDAARRCDHTGHLIEQNRGVLLMAQHGPDRLRYIGRRQRRSRDLIQKGLEEVVIMSIDHRHMDG